MICRRRASRPAPGNRPFRAPEWTVKVGVDESVQSARIGDMTLTLADGRVLAYCDVGPADAPVAMYFHGAPSSRLDLQIGGIDEQLAARGIRVVSPDRPGYGGSSPQPARAMSDWASDVGVPADHLEIDRFAVFGLSSGGPYAVAIAALLGHRINGCGVIAGVIDMAWVPAWEDYDETEVALMRTGSEACCSMRTQSQHDSNR
jgi:pimeloyl-ACP methyl ester carboxylesterase